MNDFFWKFMISVAEMHSWFHQFWLWKVEIPFLRLFHQKEAVDKIIAELMVSTIIGTVIATITESVLKEYNEERKMKWIN